MKKHPLNRSYIQNSFLKQYEKLAVDLEINPKTSVLDIGSGLGYFKHLTLMRGGVYCGLEPDRCAFENSKKLYGNDFFINKFFPIKKLQNKKFDIIIILSCLDETSNKVVFLRHVKKNLRKNSILYVAVRNKGFVLNRIKKNRITQDLTIFEYSKLFSRNGLKIIKCGKFYRPWNTGFNLIGAKNLIYKILSYLFSRDLSYMAYFKLKKN